MPTPKRYRSSFTHAGKQYERTSTKSQREADKKATILLQQLENGDIGISKQMRVGAWASEWLEIYKKPKINVKSYERHKRCIEKIINPQIGGLRLCEVTDIHVQKVLNSRAGYSFSEVKFLHDTLKAMFKKARKSRFVVYDPAEDLDMPRYTKGTHRRITDFEREHFLKAVETHHAGLRFKTMLFCGLRPGELDALDWKDFDVERHEWNIVSAKESGTNNIKAPKTEAGIRRVPIPDEVYYALLELRGRPYEPVFTQETTGKRHTETSRSKAWNAIRRAMDDSMGAVYEKRQEKDGKMRRTKIKSVIAPDLVPYCLRHTYCTDLRDKGVPLKTASYLMGHSSIQVTADIYTHITDDAISQAALLVGVSSVPSSVPIAT